MKNLHLLILLITITCNKVFAQKHIINPTTSFFYELVYNPFEIGIDSLLYDSVSIKSSQGNIHKYSRGIYRISNLQLGYVSIYIQAFNKNIEVYSDSSRFRVYNIGEWRASILGQEGGLVSSSRLSVARTIDVRLWSKLDVDVVGQVQGYSCIIIKNNIVIGNYNVNGRRIPLEHKNQLKTLLKGDMVIFSNIKIKSPSGKIQTVTPLIFEIK